LPDQRDIKLLSGNRAKLFFERNIPMKKVMIYCLLTLALASSVWAQVPPSISPVFHAGEVLQYKVKWGFVRLGTVTLLTLRDSTCERASDFKIIMKVESNPDLGFVHIREYNESLMDAVRLMSRRFKGRHRNGDDCIAIQSSYDPNARVATSSSVNMTDGKVLQNDTLRGVEPFVDGPSLLVSTRCAATRGGKSIVPTMVNGKIKATIIDFAGFFEEIEIDAFDQPIRTQVYTGSAQWTGGTSAGLSGDFTGWVSDDGAAIPIRAEMRVLLGSITIELEQWARRGWLPPTGARASTR
jgi:hypothetical protein